MSTLPQPVASPQPPLYASTPSKGGEIRSFYVSPSLLERERIFLSKYDVKDVGELLEEIHNHFSATVSLMEHFDEHAELSGFTVRLIGEHLRRSLDMLERAQGFLTDLHPVEEPSGE